LEMVHDITERGASATEAGARHGVSAVTARKWLGRNHTARACPSLNRSN
jgi:transposase-like protein